MQDNLQEYADPALYDAEYGGYQGDLAFFGGLTQKGTVLDLACGTGRLTIPLAQAGFSVTGLDTCDAMLAYAKKKADELSIQWLLGDMTSFELPQQFDLIVMTGNAFQSLLTESDQQAMLRCVVQSLKPSGLFAFNTRNPRTENLINQPEFTHWHNCKDPAGETVQVFGAQTYDEAHQIATYTTKRVWSDHETQTSIRLRFTEQERIIHLIEASGLEVMAVYGGFEKQPWTQNSHAIIPVCRLKN